MTRFPEAPVEPQPGTTTHGWAPVDAHQERPPRPGLTSPQHEPASRRLTSRSGQRHRSRASSRHAFAAACADFTDIPATPPHGSNWGDAVIAVHPHAAITRTGAQSSLTRPGARGYPTSRGREAASRRPGGIHLRQLPGTNMGRGLCPAQVAPLCSPSAERFRTPSYLLSPRRRAKHGWRGSGPFGWPPNLGTQRAFHTPSPAGGSPRVPGGTRP